MDRNQLHTLLVAAREENFSRALGGVGEGGWFRDALCALHVS